MSLDIQGLVSNGLNIAFTQLAQLVKQTSFKKLADVTYDPVTGRPTATKLEMVIDCLFLDSEQVDGRFSYAGQTLGDVVEVGDKKLLIQAKDLVFQLTKNTTVTRIDDGLSWSIVNYAVDTTESLYEVHIRRTGELGEIPTQ